MPKIKSPRKNDANKKIEELAPDISEMAGTTLTSNQGVPINDTNNTLKAGDRGPSLLEDFLMREKITHFDHERIPERAVHARGVAAHGYFQAYKAVPDLTKAGFLNDPARQTPVFLRFSTVAGSRGSADLARDVRGFAIKFYTDEGDLRHGREQHPGLLHPGRDQVSRSDPRRETGAAQRNPAGRLGARHLLRFHLAHAGVLSHAHVGDVRPRHSAQPAHDGRLRHSHLPFHRRRLGNRAS